MIYCLDISAASFIITLLNIVFVSRYYCNAVKLILPEKTLCAAATEKASPR